MNRHDLGRSLAGRLKTAEASLDRTVAEYGRLIAEMADGRIQYRLAMSVGQDAMEGATRALVQLSDVRAHTIALHDGLRVAAETMGVDYTLSGPGEDKPEDPTKPIKNQAQAVRHLRAV